jgi:hypothetical protein
MLLLAYALASVVMLDFVVTNIPVTRMTEVGCQAWVVGVTQ